MQASALVREFSWNGVKICDPGRHLALAEVFVPALPAIPRCRRQHSEAATGAFGCGAPPARLEKSLIPLSLPCWKRWRSCGAPAGPRRPWRATGGQALRLTAGKSR